MIKTLRTKLMIGIAPLLAIMIGLGLWAIVMFYWLGGNIDVILRENYRSVRAAQGMKEALERMDSAALFAIGGQEARAHDQFREFRPMFERNLKLEQNNITLPGEQELADELASLYQRYLDLTGPFFALGPNQLEQRTQLYFSQLLPTFNRIRDRADDVLNLNQRNMEDMDRNARSSAAVSIRWMVVALAGSAFVVTLIALGMSRSLLEPIRAVTVGARAMARGDLDQVVPVVTRDELGELATAFNTMARTIRQFNQAGTAKLLRAQKTAQATIDSFPDPVVVVDPTGQVERANPAARRILGVAPPAGGAVAWSPPDLLRQPLADVLAERPDYLPTSFDHAVAFRENGHERFFLPRVLAIKSDLELLGAALVLTDVTRFRLMDQLKNDMVATVSHELKTPLTGIQMAVHLLLEEVVGPLNPKQTELLLASRQDSDRLLAMINNLLDLARIEQGRVQLDLEPLEARDFLAEVVARFAPQAHDSGVALETQAAAGLPSLQADHERMSHVFDNLVTNALAHTPRGGRVVLKAEADEHGVRFLVEDSGAGIGSEHLPHIFEKFYRTPESRSRGGAGLGLAIAREIVEAHGGRIEVASEPGRGTRFTLTLASSSPRAAAEAAGSLAS
jgi:two-component system, NtrC family, sensor histidine kinase KinB